MLSRLRRLLWLSRFTAKQRIKQYGRLIAFLEAGLLPSVIVENLIKRTSSFQREIFVVCMASLRQGQSLAESFKPWIPANEFVLIDAGERQSRLVDGILCAKCLVESSLVVRKRIVEYLFIPAVLLTLMCLFLLIHAIAIL